MSIFDYGFKGSIYEMIANAGPIGKAVLLILMLFSIISWAIIIKKFRIFKKVKKETEKFYEIYSKDNNNEYQEACAEECKPRTAMVRKLFRVV